MLPVIMNLRLVLIQEPGTDDPSQALWIGVHWKTTVKMFAP